MRVWIGVGLAVVISGCRPSATVQRTTPVANLQAYRGVVVRGTNASEYGRGSRRLAFLLEHSAVAKIRQRCAFLDVAPASQSEGMDADLFLDVTVQRSFRGGGGGLVQNENLATVDVTLVLSDGVDDELVGSAEIRGKSGGIVIGNESPEEEAVNAVADSIANLLVRSGCTGRRIARARPQRPRQAEPGPGDEGEEGDPSVELVAEEKTGPAAQAEGENEEGKRLFRSGDVRGAKARFLAAIRLNREPRYVFNLCLAEESLGAIEAAVSTCKSVMAMKPDGPLADKVKLRLKILGDKQQK